MLYCIAEAYEVVGSQQLQQALAGMVPQLLAAATGTSAAPSESPPPHGVLTDSELLQIPLGAEERAEKLRKMLQEAWRHHVDGTRFGTFSLNNTVFLQFFLLNAIACIAEGRRQMYRAVNVDGAPPFEWWDDVAQAPFTNTAVADPAVSQRVYEYLGPLALAHRGNRPENQALDIEVAAGDAGGLANPETQNPEPNSRPLEDVLPISQDSVTLQMLVNQTHPEEPFRTFIPGQISELKRCLERFEGDRLASYAAMRVPVSGTFFFTISYIDFVILNPMN